MQAKLGELQQKLGVEKAKSKEGGKALEAGATKGKNKTEQPNNLPQAAATSSGLSQSTASTVGLNQDFPGLPGATPIPFVIQAIQSTMRVIHGNYQWKKLRNLQEGTPEFGPFYIQPASPLSKLLRVEKSTGRRLLEAKTTKGIVNLKQHLREVCEEGKNEDDEDEMEIDSEEDR